MTGFAGPPGFTGRQGMKGELQTDVFITPLGTTTKSSSCGHGAQTAFSRAAGTYDPGPDED